MAPGRIRVFVAGTIHLNRTLVRRFLEDDGYEVVGEEPTRENLVAAIRRSEPDAVVVDQDLLGRGMMARVRRAAPDARIIVFTAGPTTHATTPRGADGYLEKGVGLAALTALLVRLFADEPSLPQTVGAGVAAAGAGRDTLIAAAASAQAPGSTPGSDGSPSSPVGAVARLVTIASGAVLIVWGLIAMIATGGVPPPPADTTDTTRPRTVVAAGSLVEAYDALDALIAALRDGNYVLATIQAQTLMDERRQAIVEGYSLSGLDAAIAVRLDGLVGGLPQRVGTTLADILRSMYPTLPDEDQPGGGSGVVIGPATSSGPFTDPNDDVTTGEDGDVRDGTGSGDGGNDDGGGDEGEDPGDAVLPGPGDGRAWGQSHKSDRTSTGHPGGAPGGGPPPWANGNANGHDKHKHH
ncbi:MAG: response regulator [Actinomycetota bacterium]